VESEDFAINFKCSEFLKIRSPCDECGEVDGEKDETEATHEDSNFL